MPEPIWISEEVFVPAEAIEMRAVRASGPGGQNVNKVASKVELRVDVGRIQGLDASSRERLLRTATKKIDRTGKLIVSSQRTRDQHRNLEDARRKIRDLVALALIPEKARLPTAPAPGSRARRLDQKRQQSRRKQERRRPDLDDH